VLQQLFATLRDLEEAGLGQNRLQVIPLAQRRRNLAKASGWLAPALRKRNKLPLVIEFDPADLDTSRMTGGASVTWSFTAKAALVQAVGVQFTAGGTVPGPPLAYVLNTANGASGSAFGPTGGNLASNGTLTIDGQTFTVAGTVNSGDVFAYSTTTDPGVSDATVHYAAWLCLHNGGVDAKTNEDLQRSYESAKAFKAELAAGEGDLETDEDATPDIAELGPTGVGQKYPWDFLRGSSRY